MKRYHIGCTWAGAVVGAIPPLMGYAAMTGSLDTAALVLAAIHYSWQFPHFNGLSWNLRGDYSKAGYRVMCVTDEDICRKTTMRHAVALFGMCSIAAPLCDLAPVNFALESIPLNALLIYLSYKFYKAPDSKNSRTLFRYSLLYLPLILILMGISQKGRTEKKGFDLEKLPGASLKQKKPFGSQRAVQPPSSSSDDNLKPNESINPPNESAPTNQSCAQSHPELVPYTLHGCVPLGQSNVTAPKENKKVESDSETDFRSLEEKMKNQSAPRESIAHTGKKRESIRKIDDEKKESESDEPTQPSVPKNKKSGELLEADPTQYQDVKNVSKRGKYSTRGKAAPGLVEDKTQYQDGKNLPKRRMYSIRGKATIGEDKTQYQDPKNVSQRNRLDATQYDAKNLTQRKKRSKRKKDGEVDPTQYENKTGTTVRRPVNEVKKDNHASCNQIPSKVADRVHCKQESAYIEGGEQRPLR
ncbi:unnamed protein product [Bursaphelenchus okinawaensis]|uniref:Heme O synthase n=1 Tax=Bursaphelenchus okinawaensis TaxID=465554 RepID=A0A811KWS3_9BILA|nr:unnamed protein product [Bursaphelenchus okinawaensis]CAG9112547.1 unnamed protein product [Bursaphelenchus okinawaensis]